MEKAKQAVSDFVSKDGKHRTSVDQDHHKAITEEHVKPHQHENVTTAIDREVHKDHHYTTLQPIQHKETLPEQHHHNIIPVEHKSVNHGGQEEMSRALERDAAQYTDTSTTHSTTHSQTAAPVVSGEHIHHHVHEHVQPVIQKETVQPHVVHTTIPIHETHHANPVHHGTKVAPTKTLDEFTSAGGILKGRETKALHEYDGCPQVEGSNENVHGHTSKTGEKTGVAGAAAAALGAKSSTRDNTANTATTTSGTRDSAFDNSSRTGGEDVTRLADTLGTKNTSNTSGRDGMAGTAAAAGGGALGSSAMRDNKNDSMTGRDSTTGTGHMFGKDKVNTAGGNSMTSPTNPTQSVESKSFLNQGRKDVRDTDLSSGSNYKPTSGVTSHQPGTTGTESVPRSEATGTNEQGKFGMEPWRAGETHTLEQQTKKTSLVDKINPFKDADGDGKKGFMK